MTRTEYILDNVTLRYGREMADKGRYKMTLNKPKEPAESDFDHTVKEVFYPYLSMSLALAENGVDPEEVKAYIQELIHSEPTVIKQNVFVAWSDN